MKKLILIPIAAIAMMLVGCDRSASGSEHFHPIDTANLARGDAYYQCPMHPGQVSDSTADCPVCGMDLEKAEKK